MAGEIKQTIRLSGEKEYNAALKEAQRNQRTLRSELKAVTAELGSNATAQQKNEARAQSLKKQIAEQEKVVETLKKALAEAKKDYGDNEDVVQKWEQKLNAARATLADMRNGLSDAENAMRGASDATAEGVTATKSFADALGSIASVGESISGAIEGIFTDMISGVRDAITELWEFIGDAAARANNWTDIAGYWNTDPVNVQKWSRALDANGKSLADYEAIVTRLVLGGKNKEITEMLGISDVNYSDQWEYATAVMEQISELSKSGNLPENLWETIFGERRATKAMDIVNSWDSIQKDLEEFDPEKGGYGWDAEGQAALDKYYVDMERLEAKWQAIKDKVALGLGNVTADLLVNVEGSLDALNDYLNADTEEEREAAIQKLEDNVREAFEKVAAAIEAGLEVLARVGSDLQNSDDPIVRAIGNILTGITDALEWLVRHDKEVVTALKAIFGAWLVTKLAGIAGQLTSIVADIQTIQTFKDWSVPTTSPTGSEEANVIGTAAGGSPAMVGGMFDTIGGNLASTLFVSQELFNHRIKREDIDEIADYVDSLRSENAMGLPSPEELGKMGYDTGKKDPNTIELPHVALQLDPNWVGEDAISEAMKSAAFAVEDTVNRLMLGSNQQVSQQGLTSEDTSFFRGLPGQLRQALFSRIDGLRVTMDGEVVGRIVAPAVSRLIAWEATQ